LPKSTVKLVDSSPERLLARRISQDSRIRRKQTKEGDQAGSVEEATNFAFVEVALEHVDLNLARTYERKKPLQGKRQLRSTRSRLFAFF
jgi:hypothetical protein